MRRLLDIASALVALPWLVWDAITRDEVTPACDRTDLGGME